MNIHTIFSRAVAKPVVVEVHVHTYTEVIWLDQVSGRISCGEEVKRANSGDVVINQSGLKHSSELSGTGRKVVLGLSGDPADQLQFNIFPSTSEIRQLFRKILGESYSNEDYAEEIIRAMSVELVFRVLRCCALERHEELSSKGTMIKEILDDHFNKSISLEQVAERVYMSKDYMRHLFKKEYGMSPIKYIIKKRLEHAMEMLNSTSEPIANIARNSGFDDPFYFSQSFKKEFGISPSQWRKSREEMA